MHKFAVLASLVLACEVRTLDVSGPEEAGEACMADGMACRDDLVCAPVAGGEALVCAAPFEIRGRVIDAGSGAPIVGARVHGLDGAGAALGDVAVSDESGDYALRVAVVRDAAGAPMTEDVAYTLQASAADYQPFPAGLRVALPLAAADAALVDATYVLEGPTTTIALVVLPADRRGGAEISGRVVGEDPGGTLVVGEGPVPASYTLADATGAYVLFNVQDGAVKVRGYHQGRVYKERKVDVAGADVADVDLEEDAADRLGSVSGSVNLVNPGDGEATSVVLVPASVYDEGLQRGPVPAGLRAPGSGRPPDIKKEFQLTGVPPGTYKVLAGFENDSLIRDPDTSLGGTALQEVTVAAGKAADIAEAFKVTGALEVFGPGAEGPETVTGAPTFEFASDPGADHYVVRVYDALGQLVWEEADVAKGMGSDPIAAGYAGPALTAGMYYQFRAYSVDAMGTAISATEDLRGVFVAG